jgi:hypothetical protein
VEASVLYEIHRLVPAAPTPTSAPTATTATATASTATATTTTTTTVSTIAMVGCTSTLSVLLLQSTHHLFRVENWWVCLTRRPIPHPIQINPSKRATVITVNHTVRVQHWNDFKNKMAPEFNRLRVVFIKQVIQ